MPISEEYMVIRSNCFMASIKALANVFKLSTKKRRVSSLPFWSLYPLSFFNRKDRGLRVTLKLSPCNIPFKYLIKSVSIVPFSLCNDKNVIQFLLSSITASIKI